MFTNTKHFSLSAEIRYFRLDNIPTRLHSCGLRSVQNRRSVQHLPSAYLLTRTTREKKWSGSETGLVSVKRSFLPSRDLLRYSKDYRYPPIDLRRRTSFIPARSYLC